MGYFKENVVEKFVTNLENDFKELEEQNNSFKTLFKTKYGFLGGKKVLPEESNYIKFLKSLDKTDLKVFNDLNEVFEKNHRDPRLIEKLRTDLSELRRILREIIEKHHENKELEQNIENAKRLLEEVVKLSKEYAEKDISYLEILETSPKLNYGRSLDDERKKFYLGNLHLKPHLPKKKIKNVLLKEHNMGTENGFLNITIEEVRKNNKISLLLRNAGFISPKSYFYQNLDGRGFEVIEPYFVKTGNEFISKIQPINKESAAPESFGMFCEYDDFLKELGRGFALLCDAGFCPYMEIDPYLMTISYYMDFFGGIKKNNVWRVVFFDFEYVEDRDEPTYNWFEAIGRLYHHDPFKETKKSGYAKVLCSFLRNLSKESKIMLIKQIKNKEDYFFNKLDNTGFTKNDLIKILLS